MAEIEARRLTGVGGTVEMLRHAADQIRGFEAPRKKSQTFFPKVLRTANR
jgi:hypothetical protein